MKPRLSLGQRTSVLALGVLAVSGCGLPIGRGAAAADAGPKMLVTLADGRRLNFVCSGRGSPTVLLESGFGADSRAWFKVQPALARTTRVCAYDRAGSGYSDVGPEPRDGAAIARDLDQALTKAKIRGPFVVVGHSAGGLYARLFAARRAQDVAGLVLLDPTVERRVPQGSRDGLEGLRQRARRCFDASRATPPPPFSDPQWTGCVSAQPSPHERSIALRPGTWSAQVSELDSLFGRTSEQVAVAVPALRGIPLYVITASDTANAAPTYGFDPPRSAWELQHEQLASRSRYGWQRTVFSSHMIMLDRPDVVISAAEEMVRAQRAGRAPQPLLPSETESGDGLGFGLPGAPAAGQWSGDSPAEP